MTTRNAPHESPLTWANLVTCLRVTGSITCFTVAALGGGTPWNLAGLLIYWALDSIDGFLARALHQETRMGAQMDIIADRLLITFFYYNALSRNPHLLLAAGLFLFQYAGPDLYLSIQFLRWPILSPNYFHRVDRRIWALNWSPVAKFSNAGLATGLIVLLGNAWLPILVCSALLVMKIYSCVLLQRVPAPEQSWV
ncbi:MAG TPA: CDP-alcohol phosphatidyltransferase family protein [Gemmatimonadales bacterium]|jgi:CDP-diacylglycerol--glycerol-3-phosphate 3-phosphatidyltransferase|nr:CDP-alcohol phosphatidyltransferase family protein [Gemmatimonadales bacterium]